MDDGVRPNDHSTPQRCIFVNDGSWMNRQNMRLIFSPSLKATLYPRASIFIQDVKDLLWGCFIRGNGGPHGLIFMMSQLSERLNRSSCITGLVN